MFLGHVERALAGLHPDSLADTAYVQLSDQVLPMPEMLNLATMANLAFQQQMSPKDALERLALTHVLMAHGRVAWLTQLATHQKDPQQLAILIEACERSSGTFVRLLRAIGEYRQPTSPATTVSIGQANLAQQQIVQNIQDVPGKKNVDERTRIQAGGTAAAAQALSAVQERPALPPGRHPTKSTVAEEHRSKDLGRKGADEHERTKARRTIRGHRRNAKGS
jgi:hypothetical protein